MFHIGQLVVCVDDNWGRKLKPLSKGTVYTIASVHRGTIFYADEQYVGYSVTLVEAHNPDDDWDVENIPGFASERFRPLSDNRIAIFRQLLVTPPKQKVDA